MLQNRMTRKAQPTLQEPSPELQSGRSASCNRADQYINSKGCREAEAVENSCSKPSSHHRHASLGGGSQSLALHPINLNSKFDLFCSWQLDPPHVKSSIKVSIIPDPTADKEGSVDSAPLTANECTEPPEELSLAPHETLMQDAQDEALSATFSIDSRSPREEQEFILWGNAAFCFSAGRDLSGSGVQRHRERAQEESTKFSSQVCEQNQTIKHLELPSRNGGLLSLDHIIQPNSHHVATVASSLTCKAHQGSLPENEERQQLSVGSTFSHSPSSTASMIRQVQAQAWEDLSKVSSSMSFDAQSCCLDFDAQELEASSASDCGDGEAKVGEVSSEEGKDQGAGVLPRVTDEGGISTTSPDNKLHKDGSVAADEEIKIRAELELEIERELEQEIKNKIQLLTCRLEELHVLQATRQPKFEHSDSQKAAMEEEDDLVENECIQVIKEARPKALEDKDSKRRLSREERETGFQKEKTVGCQSLPPNKKQPLSEENDMHLSNVNSPVTNSKRLAMASTWMPHTIENRSHPPSSEVSLKVIKTLRHVVTEGSASTVVKPKVKVEGTSSFKHDHQSWTTSSKKFDWMKTLRSGGDPSTPRVSKEDAAIVSSRKVTFGGHVVARTLFSVDSSSTPAKALTCGVVSTEKKKSVVSSCKTHGNTPNVLLPSTPYTRSTDSATHASASSNRVSQRPLVQQKRDTPPLLKSLAEATRQAKTHITATKPTSVPRTSPRQASSGKVGKIVQTSNVGVSPPTNKQASPSANSVSSAHTRKPKCSPPAVSGSSCSVTSKGAPPAVVSSRAASCLPQISKRRVGTSPKVATSAARANKLPTSGTLGRRQAGAESKALRASMRGRIALKH